MAPPDARPHVPDHVVPVLDAHATDAFTRDEAFEREALPCLPAVARFARSLTHAPADADDLVQDTYLQAFRAWHTFREGADARRWLFTICKHLYLRRARREAPVIDAADEPELDTIAAVMTHVSAQRAGGGAAELWDRLDLAPAIDRALAALPAHYRAAELLVDVEGYGYEEAAALLDVPVGTVRSRLFRARRLLQESLMEHARDAGFAIPRAIDSRGPGGPEPEVR